MKHHRELMSWLRDTYAPSDLHIVTGHRHPRMAFTYKGVTHNYTLPSTPSDNYRGQRNAKADIRRLLGPPKEEQEVNAAIVNFHQEPFNTLSAATVLSGEGSVAFYKTNRNLVFSIPKRSLVNLEDKSFEYRFTSPDIFELTVSETGKRLLENNSHNALNAYFYIRKGEEPFDTFGTIKAECLIKGTTIMFRTLSPVPKTKPEQQVAIIAKNFIGKVHRGKDRVQFIADDKDVRALMTKRFRANFTGADSWELTPTNELRAASFKCKESGRCTLDATQPFTTETYSVSPATFTIIDGKVLVKVTKQQPTKHELPIPVVEAKPEPTNVKLRTLLETIRLVEATTPYRLRRVRDKNNNETLRWEAPRIE